MSLSAASVRVLHRIHKQLSDLRDRIERGPRQIQVREASIAKMNEELAKLQADHKGAHVRSDQKQLLLKGSEDKIEQLKVKLNAAASNREYQALKDQIAADQMAGSVMADEILEMMEKIDELAVLVKQQEQKIAAAKDDLSKTQQTVREMAGSLETDRKRLEAELVEAEKELPDDLRDQYRRLVNSKGEEAMAEVQGEFCGGCFKQLTPNDMAELSMARSIACRNCGRLIYLPEDRTAGR